MLGAYQGMNWFSLVEQHTVPVRWLSQGAGLQQWASQCLLLCSCSPACHLPTERPFQRFHHNSKRSDVIHRLLMQVLQPKKSVQL